MSALCHGCGTQIDEDEDTLCPKCRQGGGMTNKERAKSLIQSVTPSLINYGLTDEEAVKRVLAHDAEIRRELLKVICPNHDRPYDSCPDGCECKFSAELVAIMGKEVGK